MKKAILIFLLLGNITPAHADPGGWVKVDANGTIVSETIVCTPDVCGNPNSLYSQLTLLPGQRYVQITKASSSGNVAGPNVMVNNNPKETTIAKVDPVTNVATVTTRIEEPLAPKITVVKETQTIFSAQEPEAIKTTVKAPVIEIEEPETIKDDPVFLDWLELINKMFTTLFANFTWAWDY